MDVVEYSLALQHSHSKTKKTQVMLPLKWSVCVCVLSVSVTAAELVLAQICHSITLLVLVHQNIYNSISFLVTCIATKYTKQEKTLKNTFGWHRLEVVGSICSLVFLSSLCFATFIESIQTLFHSDHLDTMHNPEWILFAIAGHFCVWLMLFFITGGPSHLQNSAVRQSKSKKGESSHRSVVQCRSFTEILSQVKIDEIVRDLQGMFFVIVTCCLIKFPVLRENFTVYVDPVVGIVYIISLLWSSYSLAVDSSNILLQTIPGTVDFSLLKKVLLVKFPDILNVHEMHVWTLNAGNLVLSAHVKYKSKQAYLQLQSEVENFFREHDFKIVTLQPEFGDMDVDDDCSTCNWPCKGPDCVSLSCCMSDSDNHIETHQQGHQHQHHHA